MEKLSYSHFYDRLSYFHTTNANEVFSIWKIFMNNVREDCYMNFDTMIKKLNKDTKAFRPTWGKDEMLFLSGNILSHNTPYNDGDVYQETINGYVYVSETEDLIADDWAIVKND